MAIEKKETKRKGTLYRAYWRNPFTRKQEVGEWTPEKKEAKKLDALMRFKLEHERESFRPVDYVDQPEGLTVSAVLLLYYTKAPMEESTRREAFYHSRPIVGLIGPTLVSALTRKDLKAMEESMRQTVKQNTIQRRVSVLRSALSWAVDEEYIRENPIEGYRTKRGKDLMIPPPSPEESALLYRHAPEHVKRAIIIGCNLGVRIGPSELFKLAWADLEVTYSPEPSARWRVWAAHKNDDVQWRWAPVRAKVLPLILAWREQDQRKKDDKGKKIEPIPWAIHYRRKQLGHKMATAWKNTLRRAGITRRIRPYDLRHAFATYALEGGADLKATAKVMGHADETMILRRYQHVMRSLEQRAVEALPDLDIDDLKPDEIGRQNRYTNGGIPGVFLSTDDNPPQ